MNRSLKKCLIVSAALHALLVGAALFGSVILAPRPKADDGQVLTAFDPNMINDLLTKGGNPNVQSAPPPAPVPPAPPAPAPPQPPTPVALPPQPVPKTQPQHTDLPVESKTRPIVDKDADTAKQKKTKITLSAEDTKLVRKTVGKPPKVPSEQDDAAKRYADARQRLAKQVGSSVRSLDQNLSHATVAELPGPGGGGPLSAGYRDIVAGIYEAAWTPPAELDDDAATVTVRVTIARDGRVVNGHIIKESGNRGMDRSIQNVLENVTFIQPFPEGSGDQERTYTINFNLKAKRGLG